MIKKLAVPVLLAVVFSAGCRTAGTKSPEPVAAPVVEQAASAVSQPLPPASVQVISMDKPAAAENVAFTRMPPNGFKSKAKAREFQRSLALKQVAGTKCFLQAPAADSLERAMSEAAASGVELKLRGRGYRACLRSYWTTVIIWNKRVLRSLDYYVNVKQITPDEAAAIKELGINAQVEKILALERDRKLMFGTGNEKSILDSVEIPGKSDHIAGLAVDLEDYSPAAVALLKKYGWQQTKNPDPNHFFWSPK